MVSLQGLLVAVVIPWFSLRGVHADSWLPFNVMSMASVGHVSRRTQGIPLDRLVLVKLLGNQALVTDDEVALLEQQFIETYNKLAAELSQGDTLYTLDQVTNNRDPLGTSGSKRKLQDLTPSPFTWEFRAFGSCTGCPEGATLFNTEPQGRRLEVLDGGATKDSIEPVYDERSFIKVASTMANDEVFDNKQAQRPLNLHEVDELRHSARLQACSTCKPTEEAFTEAYNSAIQLLVGIENVDEVLQTTELEEVSCAEEETEFFTDVAVDFVGDPQEATDAQVAALEQGFVETYNGLNGLDGESCDPLFRTIVEAIIDLDATLSRRLQDNQGIKERHLQRGRRPRFTYIFNVRGRCRGCPADSLLFDVGTRRRQLEEIHFYNDVEPRWLQDDSTCFCPIDAEELRAPTLEEFLPAYNQTTAVLQSNGLLSTDFVETVSGGSELEEAECSADLIVFEKDVDVEFEGLFDSVTAVEERAIEIEFEDTYNTLTRQLCDPFFLTIENATIIDIIEGSGRMLQRRPFTYRFRVRARCRGCPTDDLFSDIGTRRALSGPRALPFSGRSLQGDEGLCFCDVNAVDERSPTQAEFTVAYDDGVQDLDLPNIDSVTSTTVDGTTVTTTPAPTPAPVCIGLGCVPWINPTDLTRTPSPTPSPTTPPIPTCSPTPDDVIETLLVGGNVTVTRNVTANPECGIEGGLQNSKVEVCLLADASTSFVDDLPNLIAAAPGIFNEVTNRTKEAKFAVAAFIDYPLMPFGVPPDDFPYKLLSRMSPSINDWESGIGSIVIGNGGDDNESQYDGIVGATEGLINSGFGVNETDCGWTDDGMVARILVVTTDAPFHLPGIDKPHLNNETDTVTILNREMIRVVGLKAPGAGNELDALANATGGTTQPLSSDGSNITDAILSGLESLPCMITPMAVGCDPLTVEFTPQFVNVPPGGNATFSELYAVPNDPTLAGSTITCEVKYVANGVVVNRHCVTISVSTATLSPTPSPTNASAFPCFSNNAELKNAASNYVSSGGASNSSSEASLTYGHPIGTWCIGPGVDSFSNLFFNQTTFNENIQAWDTSRITDMEGTFAFASSFNSPLADWDVSSVLDMQGMFSSTPYNQDISGWNVSSVTFMYGMFFEAEAFNQDISGWSVSKVTNTNSMFAYATAFDQPLASWDVSSVTDMGFMFYLATSFNQNLCLWGADLKVTTPNVGFMFSGTACQSTDDPDVSALVVQPLCKEFCS